MPTLLPVRTCEKNIGGVTGVRYSVRDAKSGVKGRGKRGSKAGKEGKSNGVRKHGNCVIMFKD